MQTSLPIRSIICIADHVKGSRVWFRPWRENKKGSAADNIMLGVDQGCGYFNQITSFFRQIFYSNLTFRSP